LKPLILEKLQIIGFTRIDDQKSLQKGVIIFKDCNFLNKVIITNVISEGLKLEFERCVFEDELVFNNLRPKSSILGIKFNDCTIPILELSLLFVNYLKIEISENTFINAFKAFGVRGFKNEIKLHNSRIGDSFKIECSKFGVIHFGFAEKINGSLTFRDVTSDSLVFLEVKVTKQLYIFDCRLGSLIFNSSEFYSNVNSSNNKLNHLQLANNEFHKAFDQLTESKSFSKSNDYGSLKSLSIINGIFHEGFTFIEKPENTIKSIRMNFSKGLRGKMTFRDIEAREIEISGLNEEGILSFTNTTFKVLSLKMFHNTSVLKFNKITPIEEDSELNIIDSDLGHTSFFNVNFNAFSLIKIVDSNLSNIACSNVTWFKDSLLNTDGILSKREIYRQLKKSAINTSDEISALEFRAREMKSYQVVIREKGSWNDKIILFLSKSNNHGLIWWKPVLWYIGLTLLTYLFIIFDLSDLGMDLDIKILLLNNEQVNTHIQAQISFWKLLSPTLFNTDYIDNQNISLYHIPVLFLLKLAQAFLIFQTVSAFRKFVKK
jgi:hypothetical protein